MKEKLFYLMFLGLLFNAFSAVGQQGIYINQAPEILSLMDRDIAINKATTGMKGWCVQLLSTDNRTTVMNKKGEFMRQFPNFNVEWDYQNPYYKLRAGAFRYKWEAEHLLNSVRAFFPEAYIVQTSTLSPKDFL